MGTKKRMREIADNYDWAMNMLSQLELHIAS